MRVLKLVWPGKDTADESLSVRLPTGAGGTATIFTGKYRPTEFPKKFLSRAASLAKLVIS